MKFITELKVGDIVEYSRKNTTRFHEPSAYAGMKGVIDEIFDNGGFCIYTGHSTLIVGMVKEKSVHLILNGQEVCYTKKPVEPNWLEKWFGVATLKF